MIQTANRKLALITGGTSGIGLGAAMKIAKNYDLALVYAQNEIKAQKSVNLIRDTYPYCKVESFQQPLFKSEDCQAVYQRVQDTFGTEPVVLINSAGRIRDDLFLGSNLDHHFEMISEHLLVPITLCHLSIRFMYQQRFGRIINISSISTHYNKRGQSSFAAAKAGIEGFSKTLALEVAHRGVTVNVISPGLIETPMTEKFLETLRVKGKTMNDRVPAARAGTANEVGALIAFLCSQEASYITGGVHIIDGGRSLGDLHS